MERFNWECSTKVRFGKGCVREYLETLVEEFAPGGQNILLGYGGGSVKKNGSYDDVLSVLTSMGYRLIDADPMGIGNASDAKKGAGADAEGSTHVSDIQMGEAADAEGSKGRWQIAEFTGIMSNPTLAKMHEGAALARQIGAGLIIGIGGGSVMDCCKAASVQACYDGDAWEDFWMQGRPMTHRVVPCGVVVTMPATGSEVNGCAVLTNEETRIKCDRDYPEMNPVFALMDPEYTLTMPLRQMRAGTFDIFSHVMETYFSYPVEANPADDVSEALMRGLIRDFRAALADPQDMQARSNIMWAASLAENRIIKTGKSKDFQAHNMEHQLSAYTNCNHGEGLAVLHPVYYRHIYKDGLDKFVSFARNVWGLCEADAEAYIKSCKEIGGAEHIANTPEACRSGDCDTAGGVRSSADSISTAEALALAGIEALQAFIREAGLPTSLRELGFSEADREMLPAIAESCFISGGAFRQMTAGEILEIYEECW